MKLQIVLPVLSVALLALTACGSPTTVNEQGVTVTKNLSFNETVRANVAVAARACESSIRSGSDLKSLEQQGFSLRRRGLSQTFGYSKRIINPDVFDGVTGVTAYRGPNSCEVTVAKVRPRDAQPTSQAIIAMTPNLQPAVKYVRNRGTIEVLYVP